MLMFTVLAVAFIALAMLGIIIMKTTKHFQVVGGIMLVVGFIGVCGVEYKKYEFIQSNCTQTGVTAKGTPVYNCK